MGWGAGGERHRHTREVWWHAEGLAAVLQWCDPACPIQKLVEAHKVELRRAEQHHEQEAARAAQAGVAAQEQALAAARAQAAAEQAAAVEAERAAARELVKDAHGR